MPRISLYSVNSVLSRSAVFLKLTADPGLVVMGNFRLGVLSLLFQLKMEGIVVLSFRSFLQLNGFFNFLWAKMLLTHPNKSVSVFLSLNCQNPPIRTFGLERKRKKK